MQRGNRLTNPTRSHRESFPSPRSCAFAWWARVAAVTRHIEMVSTSMTLRGSNPKLPCMERNSPRTATMRGSDQHRANRNLHDQQQRPAPSSAARTRRRTSFHDLVRIGAEHLPHRNNPEEESAHQRQSQSDDVDLRVGIHRHMERELRKWLPHAQPAQQRHAAQQSQRRLRRAKSAWLRSTVGAECACGSNPARGAEPLRASGRRRGPQTGSPGWRTRPAESSRRAASSPPEFLAPDRRREVRARTRQRRSCVLHPRWDRPLPDSRPLRSDRRQPARESLPASDVPTPRRSRGVPRWFRVFPSAICPGSRWAQRNRGAKQQRPLKPGRRHADDGERMLVELNYAAHHAAIVLEMAVPIGVAEHDIRSAVRAVLIGAWKKRPRYG